MIPKYKLLHEFELTFIADTTLIRSVGQLFTHPQRRKKGNLRTGRWFVRNQRINLLVEGATVITA